MECEKMSTQQILPTAWIYLLELILYGLSLGLWNLFPNDVELLCKGFEGAAWTECGLSVLYKVGDVNRL